MSPQWVPGAFLNEAINQLADAYLERKQDELREEYEGLRTGDDEEQPLWLIPSDRYEYERQRVKYHFAVNSCYGVDLNPMATELGKISLWLNVLHEGVRAPFFDLRIVTGNSLIGARREVYDVDALISTKKGERWHELIPDRLTPLGHEGEWDGDDGRRPSHPDRDVYHFLVPDLDMAPFDGDKVVRKLEPENCERIKAWRKEMREPFTPNEVRTLLRLSRKIDALFDRHLNDRRAVIEQTQQPVTVWPHPECDGRWKSVEECEYIAERTLQAPTAAGRRLAAVMDYWCALWFWPIQSANLLPSRAEWLVEVETLLDSTRIDETLAIGERLALVAAAAARTKSGARFVHWPVALPEVDCRTGFDVVLGNPPWVRVEWNEQGVLGDLLPEAGVRRLRAREMANRRADALSRPLGYETYLRELEDAVGTTGYLGARSNYPGLGRQKPNLYKCFLLKAWALVHAEGTSSFVHPEGVYDDPGGGALRAELYPRLRFHFQFVNELSLFDGVHHITMFSLNVYGGKRETSFLTFAGLYHPATIDASFAHDGRGQVPGIKNDDNGWELRGHASRLVEVDDSTLTLFASLYDEPDTPCREARLPVVHSVEILRVLSRFSEAPRLGDAEFLSVTSHIEEARQQADGTIRRECRYPVDVEDFVLGGPHFYVANPLYKTPRANCSHNQDYDVVSLQTIPDDYLPRTLYVPADKEKLENRAPRYRDEPYTSFFRHVHREMAPPTGARSLVPAIIPPGMVHLHSVMSITFPSVERLLVFNALASSLPVDFFVKTTGRGHVNQNVAAQLPCQVPAALGPLMTARVLRLNCLTHCYAPLWETGWSETFSRDQWATTDPRLGTWRELTSVWSRTVPVRSEFARRQALVELDALAALALRLSVADLRTLFRVQFPILRHYASETFYDQRGEIVFTVNRGLPGVGLTRNEWNEVRHTASGAELPECAVDAAGRPYVPPFDGPFDREEDMAHAYDVFAERLGIDVSEFQRGTTVTGADLDDHAARVEDPGAITTVSGNSAKPAVQQVDERTAMLARVLRALDDGAFDVADLEVETELDSELVEAVVASLIETGLVEEVEGEWFVTTAGVGVVNLSRGEQLERLAKMTPVMSSAEVPHTDAAKSASPPTEPGRLSTDTTVDSEAENDQAPDSTRREDVLSYAVVPQANSVEQLHHLLVAIDAMSTDDLADRLDISSRTVSYYLELGGWLGFVEAGERTELGVAFADNPEAAFASAFEQRSLVQHIRRHAAEAGLTFQEAAVGVLTDHTSLSDATVQRRASALARLAESSSAPATSDGDTKMAQTTRLPLESFDLPSLIVPTLERLGVATTDELLALDLESIKALDGVGRKKRRLLRELMDRVRGETGPPTDDFTESHDFQVPAGVENFLADPVAILQPPSLIERALAKLGVKTVNDLLDLSDSKVAAASGVGRKKVRLIRALRERAQAEVQAAATTEEPEGLDEVSVPIPVSVAAWNDTVLRELSESHRRVLHGRLIDGRTLEEIAGDEGITREGVRQRQISATKRLRTLARIEATRFFGPLAAALASKGGIVLVHRVTRLLPEGMGLESPAELVLPLTALGLDDVEVYRGFVVALPASERRRLLSELRAALEELGTTRIALSDAITAASEIGLQLDEAELMALLAAEWEVAVRDGWFTSPWASLQQRYAEALRRLRRPGDLDEIKQKLAEMNELELLDRNDHAIRTSLQLADDVFSYGHGIYVHRDYLPIAPKLLDEAVEWAIHRMKGETGTVSTKKLIEELEYERKPFPGLTPHLLKDEMSRRGPILTFTGSVNVAHAASFDEGGGHTLLDHLDRILREYDEPLTLKEVIEALSEQVTYSRPTVYTTLLNASFVVSPKPAHFQHRATLGLTDEQIDAILSAALDALPDGGEPTTATVLLNTIYFSPLEGRADGSSILWGLAGGDDRFAIGAGELVARNLGDERVVDRSVRQVVEDWGLVYPHELFEELRTQGYRGSDQTLRSALLRGDYERLPGGAYSIAGSKDVMFPEWEKRADVVRESVRHQEFTELAPDLAWKVILFESRFRPREVLELLGDFARRSDLPDALRDEVAELRFALSYEAE